MRGRSMASFSLIKSDKVDWEIVDNENMAHFQVVEQQIKKLDDDAKVMLHNFFFLVFSCRPVMCFNLFVIFT